MKRIKIKNSEGKHLISSNEYEDDDCPVCRLMKKCELEDREPTMKELEKAMKEAKEEK